MAKHNAANARIKREYFNRPVEGGNSTGRLPGNGTCRLLLAPHFSSSLGGHSHSQSPTADV